MSAMQAVLSDPSNAPDFNVTQDPGVPSQPDTSSLPATSQPPQSLPQQEPTAPTTSPAPTPKTSVWSRVVQGALAGLAGSAGAKSFGGGVSSGAAGVLQQQQQQFENQQRQQDLASQIKFRDAQAAGLVAEDHIDELKLQSLPQQLRDQHTAAGLETIKTLGELGIHPSFAVPNTDDHVTQALVSATKTQGSVPPILTVNVGDQAIGFDLSQLASTDKDDTSLGLVNKYGAVLGRPNISPSQWSQLPAKDRIDLINSSLSATTVVPDPKNVDSQIADAQNKVATYSALPSWKQDPDILSRLKKNVTFLQSAQKQFDQHMIAQGAAEAGAKKSAEISAETAANGVALAPDSLGFKPVVPIGGPKELAKRQDSFKKNADDLSQTDQTFKQFGDILSDINAGKDLTGAQSVVGLFNAIGISAEGLKGKGFRINNNTVEEHSNARGLGEDLYQKLLRLKSGDVVTPDQLKDYATIADQARQQKYVTLVNEAHNQGLNADFLLPRGNGNQLDPSTAKIFLTLTGGDKAKARAAATAKGWNF